MTPAGGDTPCTRRHVCDVPQGRRGRTRGGRAAPENGERSAQARRDKPSTAPENGTRGKRATGRTVVQSGEAAVL